MRSDSFQGWMFLPTDEAVRAGKRLITHMERLVSLMERGNLDSRAIDAWLRDNVEES